MHNDIKPQNYLVKFRNNDERLSIDERLRDVEIVLTDFGLAGLESKGGTPVFASPECLANTDRKDKSSDTFSLGRVFLMMILPKKTFVEFLFVPLIKGGKKEIEKLIEKEPILNLISKMMLIKNRIKLLDLREELDNISQFKLSSTITDIGNIITKSASPYTDKYMDVLEKLS